MNEIKIIESNLIEKISNLLKESRNSIYREVNTKLLATYLEIGKEIVTSYKNIKTEDEKINRLLKFQEN